MTARVAGARLKRVRGTPLPGWAYLSGRNRMVEQEMVPAFPAGIAAHVTRLRMTGANRLPFDQLLPRIESAARALTDARCDVVAFHCTANSMEGGKTGDWVRPEDRP